MTLYWCHFDKYTFNAALNYFFSFDDLNVRWLMVNVYEFSRITNIYVKKQKVQIFS